MPPTSPAEILSQNLPEGFLFKFLIGALITVGIPGLIYLGSVVALCRTDKKRWVLGILFGAFLCLALPAGALGMLAAKFAPLLESFNMEDFSAQAQGGSGTVTDQSGTITVTPPFGWKPVPGLSSEACLEIGETTNDTYLAIISEAPGLFDGDLDAHAEATSAKILAGLTGGTRTDPLPMEVAGLPAVRYEIRGTVDDLTLFYHHTTIEAPSGFHQIVGWCQDGQEGSALFEFEEILESLTLRN